MTLLVIRIVGTDEATKVDSILASVESVHYSPDDLDLMVNTCLTKALEALGCESLDSLRPLHPEVSVSLSANEDEAVRPSLHLAQDTLQRLSEACASFDFDPYV